MKKIIPILFILYLFCTESNAQLYSRAIGIRGGLTSGFEYRFYADDINSYKILVSARCHGAQVGVLKEFHQYDLFDFSDHLVFIYGIGVHAGYERWQKRYHEFNYTWYDPRTSFVTGLDGLAAIEYNFYEVPVSAGFEVKPFFNVLGRKTFDVQLFDFAFTLKYLF